MAQEQIRELLDLISVHDFYMGLVKHALGHDVPMPQDTTEAVANLQGRIRHSISVLRRWLALLDMAISPPMVRDALKEATSLETAEALLRYYILKTSRADNDRDKADFVATFLFRKTLGAVTGSTEQLNERFEKTLRKILVDHKPAEMPAEHKRLVGEFEFIRQEVEEFRHFDDLMDSGIVQRVREIKQSLHESFYQPLALATVASYNVFFGNKFDGLFHQATSQIKQFAAQVQQSGGSSMARIDGDVTVKQMEDSAGKGAEVLNLEYGRAQEHFRKLSKFKKVVDKKMPGRPVLAPVTPMPMPPAAAMAHVPAPVAAATAAAVAPRPAVQNPLEEGNIRNFAETIRNFNRTADGKASVVVPMPHGNVVLSPAESEAYRADYRAEKSFRADYANAIVRMVAIQARMAAEMKDFHGKKGSQYLWKPHADAMAYLLATGQKELENAGRLMGLAQDRGLGDKASVIKSTAEKLRTQAALVAAALQL